MARLLSHRIVIRAKAGGGNRKAVKQGALCVWTSEMTTGGGRRKVCPFRRVKPHLVFVLGGADHPALSRQGVSQEGAREGAEGLKEGPPQRDFRKRKWSSAEDEAHWRRGGC